MSSSSSSVSGTIVQVQLPNKNLSVTVPEGRNAVCEVKRAVASSFKIPPLLQRVTIAGGGLSDQLTTPIQVNVNVRPTRTESSQIQVRLFSDSGAPNTQWTIKVDPNDSVLDLKFLLAERVNVLPDYQKLYVRYPLTPTRVELNDGISLSAAGVFKEGIPFLRLLFEIPSLIPGHGPAHATRPTLLERKDESVRTMGDLFLRSVKNFPTKPFLGTRTYLQPGKPERGEYKFITYGEAGKRVNQFASGLKSLGINYKDTIGIIGPNRSEWTLTDMACNISGFVSVPLYDTLGPDAVQYIINHANVRVVVSTFKELKSIASIRTQSPSLEYVIVMDDTVNDVEALKTIPKELYSFRYSEVEAIGGKNLGPLVSTTKPDDLLTICYTSGTTGNPKGVMLTHGNVVGCVCAIDERPKPGEMTPDDVSFSYLPLAHIYERALQASMISNAASIGFSQGDPLKLLEDVNALRPTIFPGVPRVWQRIFDRVHGQVAESGFLKRTLFQKALAAKVDKLQKGDIDDGKIVHPLWDKIIFSKLADLFGGRVRLMVSGAAPLPNKVMDFMRVAFNATLVEGYGLTETCAALSSSCKDDTTAGHVGIPADCCQVKLVDVPEMEYTSNDRPYPRGEIWVRGSNVFQGYFKQPDITAEVFHTDNDGNKWFMTGDIGMWLPDGSLKIFDRKKALFKLSQGEYLRPEHIENVYKQTKGIANVFVHGDSNESFLVAVVYPDPEHLRAYCAVNNIKGQTVAEQIKDPRITEWLYNAMEETGKREQLRGFELVKRIYVSGEDFTVDNGLLTPTFKLKRNIAAKHFGEHIARLYKEGEVAPTNIKAKL